jgi:hypothetical protein
LVVACEALPDPPLTIIKVYEKSTLNSIYVEWSQVADTALPIIGYRLFMDSGNNGDYKLVYNGLRFPGVFGFNATNLTTGQAYRFKATAINFNGEGLESNEFIFYSCLPP